MAGKKKYVLFFLLLALCLSGCGMSSNKKDSRIFTIYYTNLSGTRLEEKNYTPKSDTFDGILEELLYEFEFPGYGDVASVLPTGVSIDGYTMGVDDLQVDFSATYLGLSNVQEVLLRAGLVKTLVQIPGVLRVRFTVDGQPLTDNDGREVAAMDEDTFIDSKEGGINSYHYVTLNLYFSNPTGDKVVKEMRNVYYSSNLIMEKVIVEQIIRGPVNEKLLPVVDPGVLIKNVQISGDVCIIDLDSRFNITLNDTDVEPETCLYAFVNAICDACDVKGVRFKIEGDSDVRFRGQVSLDQIFERNPDIIEASGAAEPLGEVILDEEGMETETVDRDPAQGTADNENLDTESHTSSEILENETDEENAGGSSSGSKVNNSGVGIDPALVEDNP